MVSIGGPSEAGVDIPELPRETSDFRRSSFVSSGCQTIGGRGKSVEIITDSFIQCALTTD